MIIYLTPMHGFHMSDNVFMKGCLKITMFTGMVPQLKMYPFVVLLIVKPEIKCD